MHDPGPPAEGGGHLVDIAKADPRVHAHRRITARILAKRLLEQLHRPARDAVVNRTFLLDEDLDPVSDILPRKRGEPKNERVWAIKADSGGRTHSAKLTK